MADLLSVFANTFPSSGFSPELTESEYHVLIGVLLVAIAALLAWITRLKIVIGDMRTDLEFTRAVMKRDPSDALKHGKAHTFSIVWRSVLRFIAGAFLIAALIGIAFLIRGHI